MQREAPAFWWEKAGWKALALSPLSALYGAIAGRRLMKSVPPAVALPVLCIGNLTVGGAGKTPTAIAFARAAKGLGLKPGIVSRGYGGAFKGTHRVDPARDDASLVGDEPMLLAAHAPVAVSANRLEAAQLLQRQGCDFIIMDDGFQSARLHVDYALIVIDARRGIGNGHVLPAGPLRAPLASQLLKLDAVLKIGVSGAADATIRQASRAAKPIYEAKLQASRTVSLKGRKFLAFAGIGDPGKFFDTVTASGGELVARRGFPDHHPYTEQEISELLGSASTAGAELITTSKDHVRLAGLGLSPDVRKKIAVLEVELVFETLDTPERIIHQTLERCRLRRLAHHK
ncbi:MAG: tetraacyldisaccharide 4'-kinase [Phyllobacterium sp.]